MAIQQSPRHDPPAAAALLQGDALRLIFKHSPTCGLSDMAYTEVSLFADTHPELPVLLVDVLEQRSLSQQLAVELHLVHQSPQVILVAGGRPLWSASHRGVTMQAVERALESVLPRHAKGEDGP